MQADTNNVGNIFRFETTNEKIPDHSYAVFRFSCRRQPHVKNRSWEI
jgi:hypothetical protein